MSFMHIGCVNAASVNSAEINLVGGFVHASGFKAANAEFQWRADGNVWSFSSSNGTNQVATLTDWIRPTDAPGVAAEDYFIRIHTVQTFGGISNVMSGSMTVGTWYSLGVTQRNYGWEVYSLYGEDFDEISFIADIRYQDGSNTGINNILSLLDGAAIIDSGSYNISLLGF